LSRLSLEAFAAEKLRALARRQLRRELRATDRLEDNRIRNGEDRLVSFACNDYLGLARDGETIAASLEATRAFGTGAGASRLITGSGSNYDRLEQLLAGIKGTEDAVVFGSGYLANVGIVPLLAGKRDLILVDELAHSCMLDGARLSGAEALRFRHNDVAAVAALLETERPRFRHCLLMTEGVFSMEGDRAPLPELAATAERHDAWLMTDDAHALGVIGAGRGSSFDHPTPVDVPLQMGTLSKAAGSYGGYLCASRSVCELVRNRARSFVFSTGLPPGTVAAAARALEIIRDDKKRVARPLELARRFTSALGLPDAESAIVPFVTGSNRGALEASHALREAGFYVAAIRPPTVPPGTSRLRFTFSAAHRDDDVARLIRAVRDLGLKALPARDSDAA
jgi:8-amino-7-oxononanoate synthase